jgi:uncharacterized membrane protein
MFSILLVIIFLQILRNSRERLVIYLVAVWFISVNVLQVGTIAGNLSIKHEHPEFPSDVFLILATVGATLTIGELLHISTHYVLPIK